MTSKVTNFLLFVIVLLQIFESEALEGEPAAGFDFYKTCFDIDEDLAKEWDKKHNEEGTPFPNSKAKCAYHAYWARETGSKDPALHSWYQHFRNLSGVQDISAYQCMLFQKKTYPPWTELQSHNCSFPCKAMYLIHGGPNEKKYHFVDEEVICKGFPAKGDSCTWSDWSPCVNGMRTRNVTNYDEGCELFGKDGTLRDTKPCIAAKKDEGGGIPWWVWPLLVAICVALGVLVYYLFFKKDPPKQKRAVKPKVEPQPRVVYDTVYEVVNEMVPVTRMETVMTTVKGPPTPSMSTPGTTGYAPLETQSVSYAPQSVSYPATTAGGSMAFPATTAGGSMSFPAAHGV